MTGRLAAKTVVMLAANKFEKIALYLEIIGAVAGRAPGRKA